MARLQPRLSTDHKVSLENDIHGDDRPGPDGPIGVGGEGAEEGNMVSG